MFSVFLWGGDKLYLCVWLVTRERYRSGLISFLSNAKRPPPISVGTRPSPKQKREHNGEFRLPLRFSIVHVACFFGGGRGSPFPKYNSTCDRDGSTTNAVDHDLDFLESIRKQPQSQSKPQVPLSSVEIPFLVSGSIISRRNFPNSPIFPLSPAVVWNEKERQT